jgi:hypothetical protein
MPLSDLQHTSILKPVLRITTAAVIAGLIVFGASAAPKVAAPVFGQTPTTASAKADRLVLPVKGSACSQHGWPAFEQRCQFDLRKPVDEVRTVRVIALR